MQVSAISAMNFYGVKDRSARKIARAAQADFSAMAGEVKTKKTKEPSQAYIVDYAIGGMRKPKKVTAQAPKAEAQTNEYVAASMHIEAPAKKELPPADAAPETYFG